MSIILQQLQLEFGDKFPELYATTSSYVKGLIGKPWWRDTKTLLASEGPLHEMTVQCLVHILEQQDVIEGYKAYTSYLSRWYGKSTGPNVTDSVDPVGQENVPFEWSTLGAWSLGRPPSSLEDDTAVEENVSDVPSWLSEAQADFLLAYHQANPSEVAEFFGITAKQARDKRNTLVGNKRRQLT